MHGLGGGRAHAEMVSQNERGSANEALVCEALSRGSGSVAPGVPRGPSVSLVQTATLLWPQSVECALSCARGPRDPIRVTAVRRSAGRLLRFHAPRDRDVSLFAAFESSLSSRAKRNRSTRRSTHSSVTLDCFRSPRDRRVAPSMWNGARANASGKKKNSKSFPSTVDLIR